MTAATGDREVDLPSDRRVDHDGSRVCCGGISVPSWVRAADLSLLTAREREVLVALGDCLPNSVIAGRWHVAERTVKKHVASVFTKLEISSRAQAAVIANYRKCIEQCP
ncbi:helix-turn-helix domain-containing protein [Streptomyces bathyalis]|uniref:helix-turn-helix domain-containing protein n=1 Tax=Streptomyces bathyalis TaxID=2710756 RepID=UPI001FEBC990|nr:helix-turn-helix transcriptional regulator [Streptomyces bathyalis]